MLRYTFYVIVSCLAFVIWLSLERREITFDYDETSSTSEGQKQSNAIRQDGFASKSLVKLNFRGDANLSDSTKRGIENAIFNMVEESCGLVDAVVVWDIKDSNDAVLAFFSGDDTIVDASETTIGFISGHEEAQYTQGMTISRKRSGITPARILMVSSHFELDEDVAQWVAFHEMGHAVGMQHVKNGIMEPYVPFFLSYEWSEEDRAEFCRIYRCDPTAFSRCALSGRDQ